MVSGDQPARYLPSGTALFPAYRALPQHVKYRTVESYPDDDDPLGGYRITTPLHSSFAAEWPIAVDVPLACGASGARSDSARQGSRTRWGKAASTSSGGKRPRVGHSAATPCPCSPCCAPLAGGPLAAGQLLNFAAAVVCPRLTRPAATYTGREIAALLAEKRLNHADLAPPLLDALTSSEVLVPVDDPGEGLDTRYIPLAGVGTLNRTAEPWESELRAVAQRLNPDDRLLWLALGKRLGQHSPSRSQAPR